MMIRWFVAVVVGVALGSPAAAQESEIEFRKWLLKGTPDPASVQAHDGSGYYVFATEAGISIRHSTDLKTWKKVGRVFDSAVPEWALKLIPGADSIWAPDIQFSNGKYWLYYSVSTFGSQRSVIGLATNTTLDVSHSDYRWEDRGLVVESFPEKNDYNAIDPAMLVDRDGRAYLFWGSYWTGIKAAELNASTGKFSTSQPENVAVAGRLDAAPTSIEAAFVIRHDDSYFLFSSWDFCCAHENSTYKVMVGRAESPLGPYLDKAGKPLSEGGGTLLLMGDERWRGPGHNSVLQTKDGDWLVYHVIDAKAPDRGRILQIRPMKWSKDGWPQVGEPLTAPTEVTDPLGKLPLVGRWDHSVDDRDHYDIFFESTGEITGTTGEAKWELNRNELLMKWKDERAPNGFWIDKVKLAADGRSYSGVNQTGRKIQGRRVTPAMKQSASAP
ncbi:MAG: arabinan endo-1,5-alpha-L-arabinosidase [Planctomycetales bacterium]